MNESEQASASSPCLPPYCEHQSGDNWCLRYVPGFDFFGFRLAGRDNTDRVYIGAVPREEMWKLLKLLTDELCEADRKHAEWEAAVAAEVARAELPF